MLLVEFFLSCDQACKTSAKLLQKIHALGHWDSKGKEGGVEVKTNIETRGQEGGKLLEMSHSLP